MAESTGDPAVAGSETHGKPVASPETTEIIEAEASEAPELRRHGGHRPSPFPHNSVPQLLKRPGRCACAAPIADSRIGRQCGCDRALLRHAPSRIPGFAKHGRIRQARTWADAASRPARSAASADHLPPARRESTLLVGTYATSLRMRGEAATSRASGLEVDDARASLSLHELRSISAWNIG